MPSTKVQLPQKAGPRGAGKGRVCKPQRRRSGIIMGGGDISLVHITLFVFRGDPWDAYSYRHVLAYFTNPADAGFHETVHVQRPDEKGPWMPQRESAKKDWPLTKTYKSHVNAGVVQVWRGQERALVDVFASTNVTGRERDSGWNCQSYILEGLQNLVANRYQTQEWYDGVLEELLDHLLDGAIP